MEKIILFIKKNIYYFFFFFCLFITFFILYNNLGYDALWEYGMSHAITKGLLPYNDFNTVSTPLFIFLFSIGLFIYDSFFVFLLEFCLFYSIIFYFLYKMIGKKTIFVFLVMNIFLFSSFIPSYNTLSFGLIVIILYFEKNKSSDYLIGFLLGLLILSKHTIGIPIFILTCIGTFNFQRIIKRLIGVIGPIIVFLIYLFLTHSFFSFIDLCFLGLFDFGSKNAVSFSPIHVLCIIIFFINMFFILKNKNNILLYYSLGSIMFTIPICDISHSVYYLSIFFIVLLCMDIIYLKRDNYIYFYILFFILLLFINILPRMSSFTQARLSNFNHYQFTLIHEVGKEITENVLNRVSSYDNYVFISYKGMFFDIIADRDITYFDIPLTGNYGYKGTLKMMNKVHNMHDYYFLIDYEMYNGIKRKELKNEQLDVDLIEYIIHNSKRIGKVEDLVIYYKK